MDFLVTATVHLNAFPDESEVREILRSHDFVTTDLSRDQLRVEGSFLGLKAVKVRLERSLNSSSAVSRHYSSSSGAPPPLTRHLHDPASPESRASSSGSDQRPSVRRGRESFVVDADVFRYAWQLRRKDIDIILENHNVRVEVIEVGDSNNISLLGRSTKTAASKLQSLLNDLSQSLRTQEVPLQDMDPGGIALLERIHKNKHIHNSVLVCETGHGLHLIGPSAKSYQLKQELLGRPVDQSGRTGRTFQKNPKRRSNSLPPTNRKITERDGGDITNSPAAGAVGYTPPKPGGGTGYSPSKYQDDKQEAAERGAGARPGQSSSLRRRSRSETRQNTWAGKVNSFTQETENKGKASKSLKKPLLNFNPKDIKQRIRNWRK
ncbi:uncharacterized protein LOC111230503 [Seriola dumerili]|uniref:uncharacterized protein LOC111230503 n=1 Tax=Seriola dumerili TaxID=41447 RepID=UPI000BBE7043|nr:uncharacterized protein LOC111230503 [Seriola dumerili]XP_022612978.1 uncharacterized protein LOC111230503 [Seriola dumerili]